MDLEVLSMWRRRLSGVTLAVAAFQLVVALGVALMPPPASSEGGALAGLLYALYYAAPLAVLGVTLRLRVRWVMALVALVALGLMMLHTAPLLTVPLPFSQLPWQRALALVLSVLSGLVEAAIFVIAAAALVAGHPKAPSHA